MPLPIQALPKGLVGSLDINTGGAGPPALADQVVGTYDLRDFYWLAKRERIVSAGVAAGGATGDFAFAANLTVPANEAWMVYAYAVSASIPIGLFASIQPCVQVLFAGGGNTSIALGDSVRNADNAFAVSVLRAFASQMPFVVPPGSIFGGTTNTLSAVTAFNAFGTIDFVRFRI